MPQISIILEEHEFEALKILAEINLRDPRAQALLIIRNELVQRELIQADSSLSKLCSEAQYGN